MVSLCLCPMIRRILLLSFTLLATACTSMVIGGGQTSGVHDQHDSRSLQQVSEDANITQRIQRILENHTLVDVDTSNGIVTLQGTVTSQREVQRIISQVYRLDGVQRVDSQLVVSSP
ncbi:MAG: BON domain-containing protein [Halobacteria archaeon]|nr:BON domain-containing protein [Halobacteria archaeon]